MQALLNLPYTLFPTLYLAYPCMKCSLDISSKRSLVFPILLFSSISLYCLLKKTYLSLLAILGTLHSIGYIFPFFPCLSLLFFLYSLISSICKASPDNHFAFLHFYFLGMVLIPVSHKMSRTSVHSSLGTLSIRSNPLNLFLTFTV